MSILSARVDKQKAKNLARGRRIPYREFPRYGISVPGPSVSGQRRDSKRTSKVYSSSVETLDSEEVKQDSRRIWVGGLPRDPDKEKLYDAFCEFGEVIEIYLPMANENFSKGFCFIEFSDHLAMEKALEQDGMEFEGRKLALRRARPRL
ncbi:MAG: RNA-binding protein [Pseudomonadota bacterium]|nr:RNA-binding protein [Pseudomonadota bacterium]